MLAKNRWEKYKRDYANSIELKDYAAKWVKDKAASVTVSEASVNKLSYHERAFLAAVTPSKIDDPELQDLAKTVSGSSTNKLEQIQGFITTIRAAGVNLAMPEIADSNITATQKYPLIAEAGVRHMEHLLFYVNAVYKSENP